VICRWSVFCVTFVTPTVVTPDDSPFARTLVQEERWMRVEIRSAIPSSFGVRQFTAALPFASLLPP